MDFMCAKNGRGRIVCMCVCNYEVGFMNDAQMMLINRRIIGWMIRALAWNVRRMMDDFYLNKKKIKQSQIKI